MHYAGSFHFRIQFQDSDYFPRSLHAICQHLGSLNAPLLNFQQLCTAVNEAKRVEACRYAEDIIYKCVPLEGTPHPQQARYEYVWRDTDDIPVCEIHFYTPAGVEIAVFKNGYSVGFGRRSWYLMLQMAGSLLYFDSAAGLAIAKQAIKNEEARAAAHHALTGE